MPRYYFHLRSPSRPVRDKTGVELSGLEAAHWHAMRLAYRLREHAAETGEDWVIAVADETGAAPLLVLPHAVPMLREPATSSAPAPIPDVPGPKSIPEYYGVGVGQQELMQ